MGPQEHVVPELTPQCLSHVFSQLPPRDAARAACVQQLWRDLVQHDEHLWKHFVDVELGLSEKRGADGTEKPSFRQAYASWRLDYGAEYWPYLPRAIKAWDAIKGWLATHYPAIRESIQPGASEAQVAEAEAALGFPLPPAVKVLYRLHNGQELALDSGLDRHEAARDAAMARCNQAKARLDAAKQALAATCDARDAAATKAAAAAVAAAEAEVAAAATAGESMPQVAGPETQEELESIFHGMFGGYSVYDHMVSVRLMPLQRAVVRSRNMPWMLRLQALANGGAAAAAGSTTSPLPPRLLTFACSFRVYDKLFVSDAATGALCAVRPGRRGPQLAPAGPGESSPGLRDGVLRWFEEYARRLAGGWYEVASLDEELEEGGSRAVSLFPLQPPAMAEAVTRGVRVRASVVYVPEKTPGGKHVFAYSIRMRLLGPQELEQRQQQQQQLLGGPSLLRCQLVSRHWIIRDETGKVTGQVNGEGVIGKYPILEPGGEEFVYCSCTHQAETRGSMEGSFRFVEGTIERPTGPAFDVVCPLFRLDIPEYVY